MEHHTVAGTHTAAGPVSMAGTRIAESYQEAYTAGNHPDLGVAPAGKRLPASPADRDRSGSDAAQLLQFGTHGIGDAIL